MNVCALTFVIVRYGTNLITDIRAIKAYISVTGPRQHQGCTELLIFNGLHKICCTRWTCLPNFESVYFWNFGSLDKMSKPEKCTAKKLILTRLHKSIWQKAKVLLCILSVEPHNKFGVGYNNEATSGFHLVPSPSPLNSHLNKMYSNWVN